MHEKKENTGKVGSVIRWLVVVIAAGVFLYAGYQVYLYFAENNESQVEIDDLADKAVTIVKPETKPEKEEEMVTEILTEREEESEGETGPVAPIQVDFDVLAEESKDIVGWIYSEDTPINYPIVQGKDNQYYLRRMANGKYNYNGSIFMDFRNDPTLEDRNTLIYGHNLINDAMFAPLLRYRKQAYYDSHPSMWIITPEKSFRLDVVAGFVVDSDGDSYTLFDSREELQKYLTKAVKRSGFQSNVDVENVEQIVTLSTCTNVKETDRYVIVASLVPVE